MRAVHVPMDIWFWTPGPPLTTMHVFTLKIWPGEEAEFYLPPNTNVKHLALPGSDVGAAHVPIDYLL